MLFSDDTGEDCMFIIKVFWEMKPLVSVEFYLESGPEMVVHWWHWEETVQ